LKPSAAGVACLEIAAARGCTRRDCPHHCAALVDDPARRARVKACALLLAGQRLTLDECGRTLAITRERIRQIERTALERLRDAADAAGLEWADLAPETPQRAPGPRVDCSGDDAGGKVGRQRRKRHAEGKRRTV
jgi:hypothetical protein